MMELAARFMHAVSSTSTGGLPGPGANGAFARLHGGLDHARPARHAKQADLVAGAESLEGFKRRLLNDAAQIFDARFALDGLIVGANRNRRATRRGRMGVENNGVARRDHVDDVAAQGRDGMS